MTECRVDQSQNDEHATEKENNLIPRLKSVGTITRPEQNTEHTNTSHHSEERTGKPSRRLPVSAVTRPDCGGGGSAEHRPDPYKQPEQRSRLIRADIREYDTGDRANHARHQGPPGPGVSSGHEQTDDSRDALNYEKDVYFRQKICVGVAGGVEQPREPLGIPKPPSRVGGYVLSDQDQQNDCRRPDDGGGAWFLVWVHAVNLGHR